MKTGAELIAIEREEQIYIHGRTIEYDVENNEFSQLSYAAECLITDDPHNEIGAPHGWSSQLWTRMKNKSYKERLIIAGALIAAEIDRLNYTGN
jgi:hypothetical protein